MRTLRTLFWSALLLLLLAGCSAVPSTHSQVVTANYDHFAGFWTGLVKGFVVLFTSLLSFPFPSIDPYDVNNNGNPYMYGFGLGVFCFVLALTGIIKVKLSHR